MDDEILVVYDILPGKLPIQHINNKVEAMETIESVNSSGYNRQKSKISHSPLTCTAKSGRGMIRGWQRNLYYTRYR